LHRAGVVIFTALAGVLFFWLLGFVVDDIGAMQGPQLSEAEKGIVDPGLVKQEEAIDGKLAAVRSEIDSLNARQALLKDSTKSSQETMNQLLEVQKRNLEKGLAPTATEKSTVAQSESLFIANQARYQSLNEELEKRGEEQRGLEAARGALDARLTVQREHAQKKLETLTRSHRLRLAALQLLVLIPILFAAAWVLYRWRTTLYAPLFYALGLAVLAKVLLVIHEYFPTPYFKYLLLLASLVLVIRVLVYLLQATKHPRAAALIKQYRDAYERFLCPICEYPIRRGPLRYAFWTRRSIRKLAAATVTSAAPEEAYVCPSCGTRLFGTCEHCSNVRHELLPFCASCGRQVGEREGRV
jgi:predicted RNA-binding Zn-ribbon protein involved in translation (DUF1610 family)